MFDLRLLFVAIVWGVNFSVVKFALADLLPLSFTVVRFLLASAFLLIVLRMSGETLAVDPRDRSVLIRLGFTGITLYNILFMFGLHATSAAHSALFISLSPLFGTLIQMITGRETVTRRMAAGLLCAFAGVVLIIRSQHGPFTFTAGQFAGDLLSLCASAVWAFYTVSARPLLLRYSALKVTALAMSAGTVLLVPFALPHLLAQSWPAVSAASWGALAFTAFISAGIAFSLWYQGVQRLGVTRTMAYHYLMPFAAVLFAAFFLGERITLPVVIGGCAILGGIALVQRKTAENKKV